jgi:hypothetical protein
MPETADKVGPDPCYCDLAENFSLGELSSSKPIPKDRAYNEKNPSHAREILNGFCQNVFMRDEVGPHRGQSSGHSPTRRAPSSSETGNGLSSSLRRTGLFVGFGRTERN